MELSIGTIIIGLVVAGAVAAGIAVFLMRSGKAPGLATSLPTLKDAAFHVGDDIAAGLKAEMADLRTQLANASAPGGFFESVRTELATVHAKIDAALHRGTMQATYIDRDDFMEAVGKTNTPSAIKLIDTENPDPGKTLHNGGDPVLTYKLQANGNIERASTAAPPPAAK